MDRTRHSSRGARQKGQSNEEDLFLELAATSAPEWDTSSTASQSGSPEYRRQNYIPSPSSHYPQTTAKPTTRSKHYPSTLSSQDASPRIPTTAPPVSSSRYFRKAPQPTEPPEYRRASAGEVNASIRPFRPSYRPSHLSSLAYDSPRANDSDPSPRTTESSDQSPITPSYADGVESVGSATPVSTVWSVAEDLKSKMKQYRSSSRRVRSSGANIEGFFDRPRTATTMTTNSTASNQLKWIAPTADDNAKHQLLRTALRRLQGRVISSVYRSLEASIADVISTSTILEISDDASTADGASTTMTGHGSSDRRLRRKVDSLCQGLTELCIALSNSNSNDDHTAYLLQSPDVDRPTSHGSATRPQSRQGFDNDSPLKYLDERRARLGRFGSTSRAPSRISEAPEPSCAGETGDRKPPVTIHDSNTSRQIQSSLNDHETNPDVAALSFTRSGPRSNTGASLLSSGDANSSDRDLTIRAPSRAATEAGASTSTYLQQRQASKERSTKKSSRDYMDRSTPLPRSDSISPSLRKTLQAGNQSSASLVSGVSIVTAGGSKALQDRLERRRREMESKGGEANGIADKHWSVRRSGSDDVHVDDNGERRTRAASGGAVREKRPGSSGVRY